MKNIIPILVIIIIDVFIVLYVYFLNFDESNSLGLIYILPIVFIGNILLGILFKLLQVDKYFLLFFNSVLGCLIAFITMYLSINYHKKIKYENLHDRTFTIKEVTYYIYFYNIENTFELVDSHSDKIIKGKYYIAKDEKMYLNSMDLINNTYIYKDTIYNYPVKDSKIYINE